MLTLPTVCMLVQASRMRGNRPSHDDGKVPLPHHPGGSYDELVYGICYFIILCLTTVYMLV